MAYQTEFIIDAQPKAADTSYTLSNQGAWNTELCDCCSDMGICLCGTFVPCILACRVSEQAGECCCLPYLPGTIVALRTSVRERFQIGGSICEDWVVMACCPLCGLCQLARELNNKN
ncbi:cornifelin homolog [Zootoca vivipara]|uniref:cornifelin homolog n=1 Tax=Zootoca vivipara TaxID=8524 RepID=UPI001591400B|nr:cornifelin homolog [Zootoca vivipara]